MAGNLRPPVKCRTAELSVHDREAWLEFKVALDALAHRIGLAQALAAIASEQGCDERSVQRWYACDTRLPAGALRAAERLAGTGSRRVA